MTCRELIELPMDYLNDELPPKRRSAAEAHSAQCADCAAYSTAYEETVRLGNSSFVEGGDAANGQIYEELVAAILAARDLDI